MKKITILIPAYNEEATILDILKAVSAQSIDGIRLEVIVVDDGSKDRTVELLEANPTLAADLFVALKTSKESYLSSLDRNSGDLSAEDKLTVQLERGVDGDPFPYGVGSNRKALEALAQTAFDQHITSKDFSMEELFAKGTLDLNG